MVETLVTKKIYLLNQIKKQDLFNIIAHSEIIRNDCLHIKVVQKADGQNYYMKFPLRTSAKKEVEKSYSIKREIQGNPNLERLVGFEPIIYGKFYGLLLEEANYSLKEYLEDIKENEKKFEEQVAIQIAKGVGNALSDLHPHNYISRDIKLSNILKYNDEQWVLNDLGASAIIDPVQRIRATKSYETHADYSSYEAFDQKGDKEWFHNPALDIFQLGVVLYELFHPAHIAPYSNMISQGNSFTPKNVLKSVNELECSSFMKYQIRRLLCNAAPKNENELPSDLKWENFRYVSINTFLEELESGKKVVLNDKRPSKHPDYIIFVDKVNTLEQALKSADNNREQDWNNIKNKNIGEIVNLYQEIIALQKTNTVKNVPQKEELLLPVQQLYRTIREKENNILYSITDSITKNNISEKEKFMSILKLKELSFLWGPDFTYKNRNNIDGKERYTYEETKAQKTHYHASLIKKIKSLS